MANNAAAFNRPAIGRRGSDNIEQAQQEGIFILFTAGCINLEAGNVATANTPGVDAFLRQDAAVSDNVLQAEGSVFDAAGPTDSVEPEDGLLQSFGAPVSETFQVTNT